MAVNAAGYGLVSEPSTVVRLRSVVKIETYASGCKFQLINFPMKFLFTSLFFGARLFLRECEEKWFCLVLF